VGRGSLRGREVTIQARGDFGGWGWGAPKNLVIDVSTGSYVSADTQLVIMALIGHGYRQVCGNAVIQDLASLA